MLVVLLFTCLLFTFSCFGLLLGICNDQYDWLHWSYCYLLVYYLLLVIWPFTRYLSRSIRLVLLVVTYLFPLTLCMCGSCLASLLLFTIFPTSRFGWVNLLAACSLLFILVLLCVTLHCSGLIWSLLSCFVLYVFSTMYLCLYLGYCYCLLGFRTGRIGFKLVLCYFGLFWGVCLTCLNFNFWGLVSLLLLFRIGFGIVGTYKWLVVRGFVTWGGVLLV